jgi:hypothetical protein
MQTSFENLDCHKVSQLIKKLKEKLGG